VNPQPGSDLTDWPALRAGDDDALGRMVARWEKPLFNFAWRYVRNSADARDLSAEVFVKLYQHRGRLAEDSNIAAWLFTTLVNLCRNRHRWRERHPSVSLEETAGCEPVAEVSSPDDAMERKETMDALGAAIDRLPHELKATLLLHHYEHLSYREIGEVTGCSERGVETRLYRARQRLRVELSELRVEAGR
jgi:RNA polymerase sigma factor (sigma-70 family)